MASEGLEYSTVIWTIFMIFFVVIQSFLTVSSHCSLSLYEHNQWVFGLLLADGQTHPADDSNKSMFAEINLTDSRTYGHGHIFCYWTVVRITGAKHRCGKTGRWSQRSKGHLELKSCYASEFNYDPYDVMNNTHTERERESEWNVSYVHFPENNSGIFSRDLHILL